MPVYLAISKTGGPEVKLPENFDSLSEEEQASVREILRKRLVHFYYAAVTMKEIPDHFDALRNENSMFRAKLFSFAGAPWEGDSLSLKYTITQACKNWPLNLDNMSTGESAPCPVKYSEEETQQCAEDFDLEQEKMEELSEMKEFMNIDSLGWVEDDEQLEKSRAIMQTIKDGLLQHSTTDLERTAVTDHFPFDDHDEES